jgi:hypothetical protein
MRSLAWPLMPQQKATEQSHKRWRWWRPESPGALLVQEQSLVDITLAARAPRSSRSPRRRFHMRCQPLEQLRLGTCSTAPHAHNAHRRQRTHWHRDAGAAGISTPEPICSDIGVTNEPWQYARGVSARVAINSLTHSPDVSSPRADSISLSAMPSASSLRRCSSPW